MKSTLEQIREVTEIVADTGDLEAVRRYQPVDCTTNPSIILSSARNPASRNLIEREIESCRTMGLEPSTIAERLTVALGCELARLVPGRVSTEVDPRHSFDIEKSIAQAREIVAEYDRRGVQSDRILIKLAATWEGIQAARVLQKEGIDCNLTLIFSFSQAIACADAGVYLISPFVGRITDWYKKAEGKTDFLPPVDPGVRSVSRIYNHYKANGIRTIVMGASFRTTDQVKALAGCDKLTVAPALLDQLASDYREPVSCLALQAADEARGFRLAEHDFRWELNADPMATEKLAEGIRNFDRDYRSLENLVAESLH